MRTIVVSLLITLTAAGPVLAASATHAAAPPQAAPYTCENKAVSRVALRPDPAPCCTGMFGCPQLLANTGLIRPKHANRT